VVIADVTVIDVVAGAARPGQTVVVQNDRIVAVGPVAETPVPGGAAIIYASGKFLIPGLWDMHAHIADPTMPSMFLQYGVTGARHMFSLVPGLTDVKPSPCKDAHPTSPRVVAAAQILDGSNTAFGFPFNHNVVKADTPEAARAGVRKIRAGGNDFVKVYSSLPRAAYFAALDEAKLVGLPVAGHVPYTVTAAEASDAGQLTIEHLDGVAVSCSVLEERCLGRLRDFATTAKPDPHTPWRVECEALETLDAKKADALFAKFAANGTRHVPTLVQARGMALLGRPDALDPEVERHLPDLIKIFWKREFKDSGVTLSRFGRTYSRQDLLDRQALLRGELELIKRMHRMGVRILAGTDTPNPLVVPGLSLHEELELLVSAGLSPAAALRAATADPAECLGQSDRYGTIEIGKRADLVLLTADPLTDIRNTRAIEVVLLGGHPVR
jgi:imidazolonepropionase-like amidohydrolase